MNSSPSASSTPEPFERVGGDAHRDRAVVPHRLAHELDRLEPEPGPVLERAAVGVGTVVVDRREELRGQVGVRSVHVDDVEAGGARPAGGGHPLLLHAADVGDRHDPRHRDAVEVARELRRGKRRQPRLARLGVEAAVPELDAGERAVAVRLVGHQPQGARVLVVPQARRHVRRLVGLGADRAVLGAHRRPAALGLHPPKRRLRPRLLDAEARAVRHLVEAVAQRLWPDLHRLEQDVVALKPAHQLSTSSVALRRAMCSQSSSSRAGSIPGSSHSASRRFHSAVAARSDVTDPCFSHVT